MNVFGTSLERALCQRLRAHVAFARMVFDMREETGTEDVWLVLGGKVDGETRRIALTPQRGGSV